MKAVNMQISAKESLRQLIVLQKTITGKGKFKKTAVNFFQKRKKLNRVP